MTEIAAQNILLVDDHPVFRRGMRSLLEDEEDIVVVGEAGDGKSALKLIQNLLPDVVVMDISMPSMNGIEATRQLAGPDVADPMAIVIITTFDLDEYVHGVEIESFTISILTAFLLKVMPDSQL